MQYIFVSLNYGDFIEGQKKNIFVFALDLPLFKEQHPAIGTDSQSFSGVK